MKTIPIVAYHLALMDDPRSYLGLHTVSMLREVLRKWWLVDIGFTDAAGRLSEQSWSGADPIPAAGNDFCRAMLASPAGRRRCLDSVREIHRLLRREVRHRGPILHSCHLGLQMAAGPVYVRGRYRGFVFACGFSSRELSRTRIARLRGAVGDVQDSKEALHGERVPILGREDIERMKDLLAYGASEMAAFEEELAHRQSSASQEPRVPIEGIVHRSPGMVEALARIKKMAWSSAPILLVGEPGTGKRLLARTLARSGPGRSAPFVVFEPSPDPQAVESALFGQVRGGSLGRVGVLESARGGIVYLSPVSWEDPPLQVKLLRLLQEGTLVPAGTDRPVEADVRLVFGIEQNPDAAVAASRLRRDLADWLSAHRVNVPPLRERIEDLGPLAEQFIRRYRRADTNAPPRLHPQTLALFARYHWPGNVTEFEEEIRSLLALPAPEGWLTPEKVSLRIREVGGYGSQALLKALDGTRDLRKATQILERQLIHEGLVRNGGNRSRLARELGISRSNLLSKLQLYGLAPRGARGNDG